MSFGVRSYQPSARRVYQSAARYGPMLWIVEPVTPAGVSSRLIDRRPLARGEKEAAPMLKVVGSEAVHGEVDGRSLLDEIAREGARRMLVAALETEVAAYLEAHHDERDADGHALVVRNGKGRTRKVTVGSGTIAVSAPRVNDRRTDRDGERRRFTSRILPPYMRRSPKVAEVLPVLYLRGLSTGDFREALAALLGDDAAGLSATNIARLTNEWETEYRAFQKRSLADRDYVYVWVDGVHFNVRLEDDRLCTLVMIGVRPDGTKELITVEDGYRESAESWKTVLRDLQRRGMRPPVVAVGDGALGFWAAVHDVWPKTREQRDWFHKLGNILDKFPKRLQPRVKAALHEAMYAETRERAREAAQRFATGYGAKYPKAVTTLEKDADVLLTFFDFPAEHWKHLRTSNVIESPFATVRLRQRVTKGAGSRTKGLLMAYKLLDMAQARWRRLDGAHLLPLVRAGVRFVDGVQEPTTGRRSSARAA
jgi:putative transposase